MQFCDKIKMLRTEKKMTQEEVANKAEVSRRAYIQYEKGEVKPKTRETYVKLAKALGCEQEYLLKDDTSAEKIFFKSLGKMLPFMGAIIATGPYAGASIVAGGIATTMAVAEMKNKAQNQKKNLDVQEEVDDVQAFSTDRIFEGSKYLQRFSATASGVIIAKLALAGKKFQVVNTRDVGYECYDNDTILRLEEGGIETWLIRYCALSEEDGVLEKLVKPMAVNAISSLVFLPKDEKRKVSIVVNQKDLFEYLLSITKDNSYGGNLSLIYVNTETVKVEKEVYVSSLLDGTEDKLMKIV